MVFTWLTKASLTFSLEVHSYIGDKRKDGRRQNDIGNLKSLTVVNEPSCFSELCCCAAPEALSSVQLRALQQDISIPSSGHTINYYTYQCPKSSKFASWDLVRNVHTFSHLDSFTCEILHGKWKCILAKISSGGWTGWAPSFLGEPVCCNLQPWSLKQTLELLQQPYSQI